MSLTQIQNLLREEDIEGLIAVGAPADEYNAEAEIVFAALSGLEASKLSSEARLDLIIHVWQNAFNLSGSDIKQRLPNLTMLAKRIDHLSA